MGFDLLLKSIFIGFSIAAPVGPIGVLCIQRTLRQGRLAGFLTGLGAATADSAYGAVAAFGLSFLTDFLIGFQLWLRLAGGAFLLYLGVRTFFSRPPEAGVTVNKKGLLSCYCSTVLLTITNPMTILSFTAVFAGAGFFQTGGGTWPTLMVIGVFLGSAFWWLALSFGVSLLRKRLKPSFMLAVNRISGAVIAAFAVFMIAGALIK